MPQLVSIINLACIKNIWLLPILATYPVVLFILIACILYVEKKVQGSTKNGEKQDREAWTRVQRIMGRLTVFYIIAGSVIVVACIWLSYAS